MLKRLKTVSMMLFFLSTSAGTAYAVADYGMDNVLMTQQSGTCTGVVKDMAGETVIGASVVPWVPLRELTGISLSPM